MRPIDDQLTKYLTDAHSIEEQALQQLEFAPRLARDPELAEAFRTHFAETVNQRRLLEQRLEARGAQPSRAKDVVMRAGGAGFLLLARLQARTPGQLTTH